MAKRPISTEHYAWLVSDGNVLTSFGYEKGAVEAADILRSHGRDIEVLKVRWFYDSALTDDLVKLYELP